MLLQYEKALRIIGKRGRYQTFVVLMLSIPACFLNAFNGFGLIFMGYTPEHKCSLPINFTTTHNLIEASECKLSFYNYSQDTNNITKELLSIENCRSWDYDKKYFEETYITKWNLVCDQSLQPKYALSAFSAVSVVGCLVYSYISDRFGRKIAFLLNVTTYIIGSTVSLFMPSFMTFSITRSLAALNMLSSWNISYTWALEYVGDTKRTLTTTTLACLYALATSSISLLAYLFPHWVSLGLVMSIPFVPLVSYMYFISESPRWLLSRGKEEEFLNVIRRMLWWQGKSEKDVRGLITESIESIASGGNDHQKPHHIHIPEEGNFLLLFTNSNLRLKTIIITFSFLANALFYVTIAYSTENLGGSLYITFMAQAIIEAPATILNLFLLERFGRVVPMSLGMITASCFCFLTIPAHQFEAPEWLPILLAVCGKFCICVTYAIVYQLGAELYPTTLRSAGMGFGSMVGDAFTALMPFIIHTAEFYHQMPIVIIGVVALVAGVMTMFLPETTGKPLPQTVADLKENGEAGLQSFKTNLQMILHCHLGTSPVTVSQTKSEIKIIGNGHNDPANGGQPV